MIAKKKAYLLIIFCFGLAGFLISHILNFTHSYRKWEDVADHRRGMLETTIKIQLLSSVVDDFKAISGVYPTSWADIPEDVFSERGLIKEESLKDYWGNNIRYRYPTAFTNVIRQFDIYSAGPNGHFEESGDDLGSWVLKG